jgi:hypothetical protein
MKLAQLIPHTSEWLGIPGAQVRTVARVLQPAGLISSIGRNPRGAEMTTSDKINLLLGVCGVEVANRAAVEVPHWLLVPALRDQLQAIIESPLKRFADIEFEMDAHCMRYGKHTFGRQSTARSVLIRRVTGAALGEWVTK